MLASGVVQGNLTEVSMEISQDLSLSSGIRPCNFFFFLLISGRDILANILYFLVTD